MTFSLLVYLSCRKLMTYRYIQIRDDEVTHIDNQFGFGVASIKKSNIRSSLTW